MKKKFIYKIFDKNNTFVKVLNDVINKPTFTYSINGGLGELKLKLNRKLDDYGEGTDLDFNYRIKIYVTDDTNDNVLIYTGYIVAFRPFLTDGREGVEVVFLPNIAKLENDYWRTGTSVKDNFTIVENGIEIGQVMKNIIDNYRGLSSNHLISNDYSNVEDTGKNITNEYRHIKHLDALRETAKFLDYDWYWYIDAEGKLHLKQKDTSATHSLFLNKQIKRVTASKDIETTRNHYFLWNVSDKTPIEGNYYDATSINNFDRMSELILNGDIANSTMCNYIGDSAKNANKDSKRKIEIEVTTEKCQIENFKPGDTILIMNIDTGQTIFGNNMMITRIWFEYPENRATLELEETSRDFADLASGNTLKDLETSTIEDIAQRTQSGLNEEGYIQREIRGSILPTFVPDAMGLYYTREYIGCHDGTNWTVYIKNDGKFYFRGDYNNYIQWDGDTLYIKGNITVTGGDAFSKTNDSLDDINDGDNYGKVASTSISGGKIILTGGGGVEGVLPTENTAAKCTDPNADQTSANPQSVAWLTDAGAMAYEDMVEKAKLGTTIIEGGYIKTELLTADNIQTGTLTGRTVRTAASGARVQLDSSNYLQCIDSGGTTRAQLNTTSLSFKDSEDRPAGRLEGVYDSDWSGTSMYYYGNIFNIQADSSWSAIIALRYNNNAGSCAIEASAGGVGGINAGDLTLYSDVDIGLRAGESGIIKCNNPLFTPVLYSVATTEFLDLTQTDGRLKQNLICYTNQGKNLGDSTHQFASVFQNYVRANQIRNIGGSHIATLSGGKMDLFAPLVLNCLSSDPANPVQGETYLNTTNQSIRVYRGSLGWGTLAFV